MAKKGRLNKVEMYYIDNNYKVLSIADIAADLDRTILSIEKYIKENLTNKSTSIIKAGDQLARQQGVVAMTENASMLSDSKRKRKPMVRNCITRIKDDV